jgi:hypothetical protein
MHALSLSDLLETQGMQLEESSRMAFSSVFRSLSEVPMLGLPPELV